MIWTSRGAIFCSLSEGTCGPSRLAAPGVDCTRNESAGADVGESILRLDDANDVEGWFEFDPKLLVAVAVLGIAERIGVFSWGGLAWTSAFNLLDALFAPALIPEFKPAGVPKVFGGLILLAPSDGLRTADFAAASVDGAGN